MLASARLPPPHRLGDHDHLVHGDLQRVWLAPQIDAHRIAHRDDIHPGAIDNLGNLVIPGNDADDFLAVALHLVKRGNGDLIRHGAVSP